MACVRKRRGKWVVDYRDSIGKRRWVTCETRRQADQVLAQRVQDSRQRTRPDVDPEITIVAYSARWLHLITGNLKERTIKSYEQSLRVHLVPALGTLKVRQLHRGRVKMFLADKLKSGLRRNSVRIIHSTLRAMLNAAIEDSIIVTNPAEKLGRQLRLVTPPPARQEQIKAMTRVQLATFLATARKQPRYAIYFLALARSGIRPGEGRALQWPDFDFMAREMRVQRGLSEKRTPESPKSGHGRTVDMSRQLTKALLKLQLDRKSETLRRGWSTVPPWVFCTSKGTPIHQRETGRVFKKLCKAAGLPTHFTPHGLRHTYASLLLQQGVSPAYVQRQLGHASIKLTVDTYGKWLPMGDKRIVDRLDDESGSKMVANAEIATAETGRQVLEVLDSSGEALGGG